MDDTTITFTIAGEGVSPASIDSKDLVDLIDAFQSSIMEKARVDNPTADIEHLFLSLTEIKLGSACYVFSTSNSALINPAFKSVQRSIKTKNAKNLPSKSIESLKRIQSYIKKRNLTADFALSVNNDLKHAVITKDSTFASAKGLKGETYIYGTIIRVGGKEPTVTLEYDSDFQITCNVSREVAKKLASRLYDFVGLRGIAKWVGHEMKLDSFKVIELLPFEERTTSESIKELTRLMSKYYKDIDDPESYVKKLRGGEGN